MDVTITLLGDVEARVSGRAVPLGGTVPRALLARLASSPQQVVTVEELVAAAWVTPPDSILATLRAHLSRLRTAGLGAALVGGGSGYVLDVPPASVDVAQLRSASTEAASLDRPERIRALITLATSAGLEALPGLDDAPFARHLRAELAQLRLALELDLGDACLEEGDDSLAIAVLTSTVERHPTDERPVRLLATALARASRRGDALAVLDQHSDRVRESSTVETSPRIAALRSAVVRLDPGVVSPVSSAGLVERFGVPIPLTRFVGREDALRSIRERRHTARLVTLVGPAGVGKTRLAIEIAREATTALDDEQYMVDLADVSEPEAVASAIASVVRATELDVAGIGRRLRGSRSLLVLDNADHVLGALAVVVEALLGTCPRLRVLVTSREPLRVEAESTVVVQGLAEDEAWHLFLDRAMDARGGEPIESGALDEARRLCRDMEGSPLAIELASARLDLFEPSDVRAGMGSLGGAGRHGSVEAAIDWTFGLLRPDERDVLLGLSRFAGAFTTEVAAGVSGMPDPVMREILEGLIGKSLVAVDRGPTGRRRLRLLEATREFLRARRDSAGDEEWFLRHRRWFAGMATRIGPSLRSFEARDTMAVLDHLRPDLDAAFESAIAHQDRATAIAIVAGIAHYWYLRGLMRHGREQIDRALDVPGTQGAHDGLALVELANLAFQIGDTAAAFDAIAHAAEWGRAHGDATVIAVACSREAYGRSLFGDVERGEALLDAARRAASAAAPWARAELEMCAGQTLRAAGDTGAAIAAITEAHRIAASVGYTWMTTSSLYVLAKSLIDARRAQDAIRVARSAVVGARTGEDAAGALALVHVIAAACSFIERHEVGARLLGAIDEIGLRYDYSTAAAEGDEADSFRRRLSAGMMPGDFEREYRNGRGLGWDGVMDLLDRLPRARSAPLTEVVGG